MDVKYAFLISLLRILKLTVYKVYARAILYILYINIVEIQIEKKYFPDILMHFKATRLYCHLLPYYVHFVFL